jgi:hypothetical protein
LTLSNEAYTLPEKLKVLEITEDIKYLTGILKAKYPAGTSYGAMKYEYLKGKYKL